MKKSAADDLYNIVIAPKSTEKYQEIYRLIVQFGRPSTPSWVQPVLSKVNVTCSRPQRNVHRPGIEPGTP